MSTTALPTLGGSTAAAAAGIDPHCSRVMLWLEMTGRVERVETEAMRWGNLLQPVVIAELRERGYDACGETVESWRDELRPWLVGHTDGFVNVDGSPLLLEVKTAGPFAGKWGGEPPAAYVAQCQVYMHLTGLDRALLACLVGGQRLEVRTIDRSPHAIGLLLRLMEEFYGYVMRDEPPPPDGSDSARAALLAMYPSARDGLVHRLTRGEWNLYTQLVARRAQRDALDEQVTELENLLKLAMGDAETAVSPHDTDALQWRNITTNRVDTTRLRAELPELAERFTTTTDTRRFTVV